jgi:hypothetical protein
MAGAAWIPLMRTPDCLQRRSEERTEEGHPQRLKEWGSVLVYAAAIALILFCPHCVLRAVCRVAAMWFVPDRRIEEKVNQ